MRKRLLLEVVVLIGLGVFTICGSASADVGKLIGSLTDLLGVNEEQASGGAGAVFRQAKNNMSSGDYSQLLKAIPGIDSLIQTAPQVSGLAGKASSMFGSSLGSASGLSACGAAGGAICWCCCSRPSCSPCSPRPRSAILTAAAHAPCSTWPRPSACWPARASS